MPSLTIVLRRALLGALLCAPSMAMAQGPLSSGQSHSSTNDLAWQLSIDHGSYFDAFLISRGSASVPKYSWIGASASGSIPGGYADWYLNRFTYTYRTSFLGAGLTSATFQCAVDDVLRSIKLNGATVSGGCGYELGAPVTLTGFNAGSNTLEIEFGGNGITDGMLVNVTDVATTSTPEPASLALLATGLVGIVGVARRKNGRRVSR